MEKKEDYEKLYGMLAEYAEEIHKKNQRRIKIGMKCLLIIPMIFLVLLMLTDSSKIVFLILWIVSLFILAGYLIFIEYSDEISHREEAERDALIGGGIAQVEERLMTVIQNVDRDRNDESAESDEEAASEEAPEQTELEEKEESEEV